MNRNPIFVFAVVLSLLSSARAVSFEAALFAGRDTQKAVATSDATTLPRAVYFREVKGRGLLARVWVNSAGPFTFAIDTGAGASLVSPSVASQAHLQASSTRGRVGGLSGVERAAQMTSVRSFALGDRDNYLPATGAVMITGGLPRDIDGLLDPNEVFGALGYVIDLPRGELSVFDPHQMPLERNREPEGGAVVSWVRQRGERRPFVKLDNGDLALLDTGSSLGLAVRQGSSSGRDDESFVRDVGGGNVSTRRIRPTTVAIGSLTLRNVPTDLISGAESDAPVLLGLNALRPFTIKFDPLHRLIEIAPTALRRR